MFSGSAGRDRSPRTLLLGRLPCMNQTSGAESIVLLNRRAGSGRAGRFWDRYGGGMRISGALVAAATPEEAQQSLDAVIGPATRRLIAVGGDGTFHCLVNEVMRRGLAGQVELGLLPLGTGSDLASTLGLPRRPKAAIAHLAASSPRPMDLLEVDLGGQTRFAANVASLGLSADVARIVNGRSRRWAWTYLEVALRQLLGSRPRELSTELDGNPWFSGPVWLLVAANGPRFARGMRIMPYARVDDGLLDCMVASSRGPWSLIPHMPRLYLGLHLRAKPVHWSRGEALAVHGLGPDGWLAELDGEHYPARQFTVRVRPGAIKVLS